MTKSRQMPSAQGCRVILCRSESVYANHAIDGDEGRRQRIPSLALPIRQRAGKVSEGVRHILISHLICCIK